MSEHGDLRPARVTIGLPVYNGERFLRDALTSILSQTFDDFRLVVSDNGSTDASASIIEEFASSDARVIVLRSDRNRGAAWNYNRVFAECQSPYFKWAAADDMLAPAALERLVGTLDAAARSVVLVYPRTQMVDETGQVLDEIEDAIASPPGAPPHVRLRTVVRNMIYGNCIYSLVRSDAMRRTRLHGSFPSADYVLLAELALVGDFEVVPEPLFLRRLHEGTSVRANRTQEALTSWFDPSRRTVRNTPVILLKEYVRGVGHARLTRRERLISYLTVAGAWARRHVGFRSRVRPVLHPFRRRA